MVWSREQTIISPFSAMLEAMDTSTNPSPPPRAPRAYRVTGIDGSLPVAALPKVPDKYVPKPPPPPPPPPPPAPATEGAGAAAQAPAGPAAHGAAPPNDAQKPAAPSAPSDKADKPSGKTTGLSKWLWWKKSAAPTDEGGWSADSPLVLALVLSLAAAVSLGITRFAYGLLLPPMRQDLNWSYALAGGMNTANAVGYLLGALSAPWLMRVRGTAQLLVGGSVLAAFFMAASGFFLHAAPLLLQRFLAGIPSAWVFVAAGVLAARLGTWHPQRSGLLLGIVYGGVGWGIVLSAWAVPAVLQLHASHAHAWTWAWWWLALACLLAALVLIWPARWFIRQEAQAQQQRVHPPSAAKVDLVAHSESGAGAPAASPVAVSALVPLHRLGFALAGYACFGIGYIGYMTFVIALLRDRGTNAGSLTLFYALLGLAVVASSRIWAGLLDKAKAGGALALLNGLLGMAVLLPAVFKAWELMLLSGVLFGAVFLSVVASTTALVRHNLPAVQWPAGISAFTIVFALGQIVGPTMVGWIADGSGNLELGLLISALVLWVGGGLAMMQKGIKPA